MLVAKKFIEGGSIKVGRISFNVVAAERKHFLPVNNDDSQFTTSDAEKSLNIITMVKVTEIPKDMVNATLYMLLENAAIGGGDITELKYKDGENTAVVDFKDPCGIYLHFFLAAGSGLIMAVADN